MKILKVTHYISSVYNINTLLYELIFAYCVIRLNQNFLNEFLFSYWTTGQMFFLAKKGINVRENFSESIECKP